MEIYVKYLLFSYFFLAFKHDFIRCVDFTRMTASNTASDDVTNYSCIEYLIGTYHILVLIFLSKLMNNLALMASFNTI